MKTQLSRKAAHRIYIAVAVVILTVIAVGFLLPIVLTVTNSFMESTEISANYGVIFGSAGTVNKTYIAEKVNLKFIPDQVSFSQYITAFVKSPALSAQILELRDSGRPHHHLPDLRGARRFLTALPGSPENSAAPSFSSTSF